MIRSACMWLGALIVLGSVAAHDGIAVLAQTAGQPIRLSAWAVSMANVAAGANAVLDIRVNKWSTDKQRQDLIAVFLDKGQDALLHKLQDEPEMGRISIPGRQGPDPNQTRLGWTLRYANQTPLPDGGTRILIATDRVMSFQEVRNRPRSYDYPFTFLEIHLTKDGTGEGKMALATQLKFDKAKNAIIFENYSTEPVRLNNIKVEKSN